MKPLVWEIGDVVRKVRETQGKAGKEIADAAGITPNTYSDVENMRSNFTHATLEKIAHKAFGLSASVLYAHIPHDPENCGRHAVTSGVTLPDDNDSRALATIWRSLAPEDRKNVITIVGLLAQRAGAIGKGPGSHEDGD